MVAPGMTTDAIDELVTRETIARGAYPSPLNYHNFPKSCCTSINEVICHGIPDSTVLKDGDIVNLDITCYIGGYHGDCSETFLVGNVDEAGRQLVKVTHDCWQAAIEYCKPGQPFSGIGKIIEDFVKPCVARTECPTADAQDAPPHPHRPPHLPPPAGTVTHPIATFVDTALEKSFTRAPTSFMCATASQVGCRSAMCSRSSR
jgi:methionyl aminopeptidase